MSQIRIHAPTLDPADTQCSLADGTAIRGVTSATIEMQPGQPHVVSFTFNEAIFDVMAEADLTGLAMSILRAMEPAARRNLLEAEFWLDDLEAEADARTIPTMAELRKLHNQMHED